MRNIQISAYMTSIRPYRWADMHETLKKTGLSFEIVVVGPNSPDTILPREIRFFKSDAKPSQCQNFAAKLAQGEMLLQIVDDMEYQDEGINAMHEYCSSSEDIMATCHYFLNGQDFTQYQNIWGHPSNSLPLLPVCGMFPKKRFEEIGGIDKRFDGVMGELDLYMRLYCAGMKTVFVDFKCNENQVYQNRENSGLCYKYWHVDRPKFLSLWESGSGALGTVRNDAVQEYTEEDLLAITGEK